MGVEELLIVRAVRASSVEQVRASADECDENDGENDGVFTLPPAAAPGMYAVELAIHKEET